jgi:hypothetical protein
MLIWNVSLGMLGLSSQERDPGGPCHLDRCANTTGNHLTKVEKQSVSEFRFVLIVIGIMLGLGLTQIIRSVGDQLRRRAEIQIYPLQLIACVLLFYFILVWMWGFTLFNEATWNFATYILIIAPATALSMSAQLICPDLRSARSPEQQYFANSRPLYLVMSSVFILSIINTVVNSEYLFFDEEVLTIINGSRLLGAVSVASMAFIRKPAYHWLILIGVFIVLSASVSAHLFLLHLL